MAVEVFFLFFFLTGQFVISYRKNPAVFLEDRVDHDDKNNWMSAEEEQGSVSFSRSSGVL